jgi:hypothetical protein
MRGLGVDDRATVMRSLQRDVGNRGVSSLIKAGVETAASLVAAVFTVQLTGSVGRGGENQPADVAAVEGRLRVLGFMPLGTGIDALGDAIERYQRTVVRLPHPDGRVDPGGATVRALNAGRLATQDTAATPAPTPAAPPSTPPAPSSVPPSPTATTDAQVPPSASPTLKALSDELGTVRAKAAELDKQARKQGYGGHWQETGQPRAELVAALKKLRAETDALTAADVGGDAAQLARTRAALYREEDDLAPYYYQMVNANILSGNGLEAGGRTCNITSISMTLQALGKTPADYTLPDKELLPLIAAQFDLTKAEDRLSEDPAGLRLPDFLQLLAIAKFLNMDLAAAQSDPTAFQAAVKKARDRAASKITDSGWFTELISGWGLKAHNVYPFSKQPGWEEIIDRIGEVNRGGVASGERELVKKLNEEEKAAKSKKRWSRETLSDEQKEQVREDVVRYYDEQLPGKLRDELEKLKAQRDEIKARLPTPDPVEPTPKKRSRKSKDELAIDAVEKQIKAKQSALDAQTHLADLGVNKSAGDPRKLDAIIPIDQYQAIVGAALAKELDAGNQIVGHVYQHFIRVEDVHDDGIVIDDPGAWNRKNYLLTWDEARSIGGFARFTVISAK